MVQLPLADGGEGTLDALVAARGGELRRARVTGPDGRPVDAEWGLLPDGTAVVEMARASGLQLVDGRNDPLTATSRGTGELIAVATAAGAASVLLGVGGSATVDGGSGVIEALEWGLPLPVVVACDVQTTFMAAAEVFGPQKGAARADVEVLTRRLEECAHAYRTRTGVDVRELAGSGAAGGVAGALAALGATLRSGFDVVAEACDLDRHIRESAFVLTGEGRLDRTSLDGKVVGGVVRAVDARGVGEVAVVAGSVAPGIEDLLPSDTRWLELCSLAASPEDSLARAYELARLAAERLALAAHSAPSRKSARTGSSASTSGA